MTCELHSENNAQHQTKGPSKKIDWLLWVSGTSIIVAYFIHWQLAEQVGGISWLHELTHAIFELTNTVWWGVLIGILMISVLGRVPREFVMCALGTRSGSSGIVRATFATMSRRPAT